MHQLRDRTHTPVQPREHRCEVDVQDPQRLPQKRGGFYVLCGVEAWPSTCHVTYGCNATARSSWNACCNANTTARHGTPSQHHKLASREIATPPNRRLPCASRRKRP